MNKSTLNVNKWVLRDFLVAVKKFPIFPHLLKMTSLRWKKVDVHESYWIIRGVD